MPYLLIYLLVIAGAAGVYVALPKEHGRHLGTGAILALVGLAAAYGMLRLPEVDGWTRWLFYGFGGAAMAAGVAMITSVNPVYSALWFALVVLSVCGLFLLQDAQFLAAATVLVYAGAIIVTFLFVLMLAQPRGTAAYDRVTREPALGVLSSFIVLAALLATLAPDQPGTPRPPVVRGPAGPAPAASVATLGGELFSTHLVGLEIAGVLLLVALVGAMAVVMTRSGDEDQRDRT